jgi:hypothetical protein
MKDQTVSSDFLVSIVTSPDSRWRTGLLSRTLVKKPARTGMFISFLDNLNQ